MLLTDERWSPGREMHDPGACRIIHGPDCTPVWSGLGKVARRIRTVTSAAETARIVVAAPAAKLAVAAILAATTRVVVAASIVKHSSPPQSWDSATPEDKLRGVWRRVGDNNFIAVKVEGADATE
jgi:hypothetical protein